MKLRMVMVVWGPSTKEVEAGMRKDPVDTLARGSVCRVPTRWSSSLRKSGDTEAKEKRASAATSMEPAEMRPGAV